MNKRLSILTLFALLFGTSAARADSAAVDAEQSVIDSIAALRAEAGLAPLVRDADLDEAALLQAEDMAAHDYVGHVSERTHDPAARARLVGARVRRVGENVARAESTAAALTSLSESEAHRAQILSRDFSTVGVAVVEDDEGFYVVQVFGVSIPQAAPVARMLPPPATADVDVPAGEPIAPDTSASAAAPVAAAQVAAAQVAAAPVAAAPVAAVAEARAQSSANGQTAHGTAQASQTSGGAPIVTLDGAPQQTVAGYWIQSGGRWWYYPVPRDAVPGQRLEPSSNAPSAPSDIQSMPTFVQPYAQPYTQPPQQQRVPARRGFFVSPRRI